VKRLTWDLRYDPVEPVSFTPFDNSLAWNSPNVGYMVLPGTYQVSLQKFQEGKFTELVAPQRFRTIPLNNYVLAVNDKASLESFNKKVAELSRAMSGANAFRKEMADRLPYLKQAVLSAPQVPLGTYEQVVALQTKLDNINRKINGDNLRARYEGAAPPSLKGRIDVITGALWTTTAAPTESFKSNYNIVADSFESVLADLTQANNELKALENTLEKYKAPFTPGRLPNWKKS